MHQSHNIPWHLLSSHLKYKILQSGHLEDRDLWPVGAPRERQDLEHFARKFHAAIRQFSAEERGKYPSAFPTPQEGRIFPSAVFERLRKLETYGIYPGPGEREAFIEYWIEAATSGNYSTSNGDLADTIKLALLYPDQGPLLTLANHPQVPLITLHYLSWGHSFGFSWCRDTPLRLYILMNVLEATEFLSSAEKRAIVPTMPRVNATVSETFSDWDYPLQNVPQWTWITTKKDFAARALANEEKAADVHSLLKELWRALYYYDMLMSELGHEIDWTQQVLDHLSSSYNFVFANE